MGSSCNSGVRSQELDLLPCCRGTAADGWLHALCLGGDAAVAWAAGVSAWGVEEVALDVILGLVSQTNFNV